jgi:hypothetical protein
MERRLLARSADGTRELVDAGPGIMYHYQNMMRAYATELKVTKYQDHPGAAGYVWPLRLASLCFYIVAVIAWWRFAEVKPN